MLSFQISEYPHRPRAPRAKAKWQNEENRPRVPIKDKRPKHNGTVRWGYERISKELISSWESKGDLTKTGICGGNHASADQEVP